MRSEEEYLDLMRRGKTVLVSMAFAAVCSILAFGGCIEARSNQCVSTPSDANE